MFLYWMCLWTFLIFSVCRSSRNVKFTPLYGTGLKSNRPVIGVVQGPSVSRIKCAVECENNPNCTGFNSVDSEGARRCELLNGTAMCHLSEANGTVYYEEVKLVPDTSLSNCQDIYEHNMTQSGVYQILIDSTVKHVYCDMSSNEGWMVVLRRCDGSEKFNRGWHAYKEGFGNPNGEFWFGNKWLHRITSGKVYTVRFELTSFDDREAIAEYPNFSVGDESVDYRHESGTYRGTAGDSLMNQGVHFSTHDRENDIHPTWNCADVYQGGWWYIDCGTWALGTGTYGPSPPNYDIYSTGIYWRTWLGWSLHPKSYIMKIKPL